MEKKIVQIVSVLTHPLLLPTYIYLVLFSIPAYYNLTLTSHGQRTVIFVVFIATALTPLSIILLLLRNKSIKDKIVMEKRHERILPLIITSLFYYANYYLLATIPLHPVYQIINIIFSIIIVVALIVSFFWKVSLHMIGWGALVGILIAFSLFMESNLLWYILGAICISGIVASARLILKSHHNNQVYLGFLMGFGISIISFFIYFL